MDEQKRRKNESMFGSWEALPSGGRRYRYDVSGRYGWKARYVKEVNADETTYRFYQEVYNNHGELVEIHEKYPVDTGHRKIEQGEKS